MIGRIQGLKLYCKEDISLIENYDKAIADTEKVWDLHHRLEIQEDKILSQKDLKNMGLFYHRPASELIFLTKSEHVKLHSTKSNRKEETKEKQKKKRKPRSEEVKRKLSEKLKGRPSSMRGKHHTKETKRKISESEKLTKSKKKFNLL